MRSKSQKKKNCIYNVCQLPKNNNAYLFQLVYAVITAIILGGNRNEFTLISILLYIAPFLIDLTQNEIESKAYGSVRMLLILDDILLLIFAICGMFIMDESEQYFTIKETAILFNGFAIGKQIVFFMCFANIVVPLLLYKVVPCQAAAKTFEMVEEIVGDKKFEDEQRERVFK